MNRLRSRLLAGKRDLLFVTLTLAMTAGLLWIPSGFSNPVPASRSERTVARIESTDNSLVKQIGPIKEGEQQLELTILRGKHRGEKYRSTNLLIGKLELDKLFQPGDRAFVVLDLDTGGHVVWANAVDHYRTDSLLLLAALFAAALILVAGVVGFKSIVSFAFTAVVIVKFLLPSALWGWDPLWTTLIVVTVLTSVIILLVAGFTRKALTALAGSIGGVLLTSALAVIFTALFHIHGAVQPFTETLLYSGFPALSLGRLFVAGIFLASSGAVMDLAMDIAASMDEIAVQNQGISRWQLIRSGCTVSRHVTGTMTTTLLLAYSGGYTGLLMTFIAQGVPLENALNIVYVSSELVHTLVGSFGLVLVGPLTAVAGGLFLTGRKTPATLTARKPEAIPTIERVPEEGREEAKKEEPVIAETVTV